MNLIEQLKRTSGWKNFEKWYEEVFKNEYGVPLYWKYENDTNEAFDNYPFILQKGVFERFIIENSKKTIDVNGTLGDEHYAIYLGYGDYDSLGSFEDLLIWHFNQE